MQTLVISAPLSASPPATYRRSRAIGNPTAHPGLFRGVNARGAILSIVLLATAVAGCDAGADPPGPPPVTSGPPGASGPPAPSAGCDPPAAGPAAAGAEVVPVPSNGVPASTTVGQTLVLEALILDRQCRPVSGADVHLWHADAAGLYGPAGSDRCCYYDGTVRSDADGRFRVRTIRPAQYPVPDAPPAHIHLELAHAAGHLETEIIFGPQPSAGPVAPTGHELVMALRPDGAGWRGEAVFVLS